MFSKKPNCLQKSSCLTYSASITGQFQNMFKRLYFGFNFLSDLAEGAEAPLAPRGCATAVSHKVPATKNMSRTA